MALLLAGGGEFAFVVFKLAEDLGLLPTRLCGLLTASVIISMSPHAAARRAGGVDPR